MVIILLCILRMVYICQLCSFSSPMISVKPPAIRMQGVSSVMGGGDVVSGLRSDSGLKNAIHLVQLKTANDRIRVSNFGQFDE